MASPATGSSPENPGFVSDFTLLCVRFPPGLYPKYPAFVDRTHRSVPDICLF